MNIFLTSQASNVLLKITSMLPKKPSEYKVLFIPTASNPYPNPTWVKGDRDKLIELGFNVEDFDLDGKSREETTKAIRTADIIFVAGGNTFYLLEKAKKTGFDIVVKEEVDKGKIFIGSSAGSVLVAPDIQYVADFDELEEANLENTQGIGLVNFAILPHSGNSKYKELHDKVLEKYKRASYEIIEINDDQFVIPVEDKSWQIITV